MLRQTIVRTIIVLGLVLSFGLRSAVSQENLCGPVYDGAKLTFSWECFNDSLTLFVDHTRANANGWQYTSDSLNDGVDSHFEIFCMAFKETADEVFVAIGSNLPAEGKVRSGALNGRISYGDLFINFTPMNFVDTSNANSFYGVRFDPLNDSGVTELGVYGSASAQSVASQNIGFPERWRYENKVTQLGGQVSYGDYPQVNDYYDLNTTPNVLLQAQRLGDIMNLTPAELANNGFEASSCGGLYTVGFKFTKQIIRDRCGVNGGDGTSCVDCANVACGESVLDECLVCNGNGQSCLDCAGVPHGQATYDVCNVCNGNGTSCLDCNGIPNGPAVLDRCGECGGNGNNCLGCNSVDITKSLAVLDGGAAAQRNAILKLLHQVSKYSNSKSTRNFVKTTTAKAESLNKQLWEGVWTGDIPRNVQQCGNTAFCITSDLSGSLGGYQSGLDQMYSLVVNSAKRLQKLSKKPQLGSNVVKNAKRVRDRAVAEVSKIPTTTSSCS